MKTLLLFALLLTTTLIGCKVADSSVTPTTPVPGACKLQTTDATSYDPFGKKQIQRSTGTYDANGNLTEVVSQDTLGNITTRSTYSGYVGTQYGSESHTTYTPTGPKTKTVTLTRSGGKLTMIDTDDTVATWSKVERFRYDANGNLVVATTKRKIYNPSFGNDSLVYKNNATGKADSVLLYWVRGSSSTFINKKVIQYNSVNDPIRITTYRSNGTPQDAEEVTYSNTRNADVFNTNFSIGFYIYPIDDANNQLKFIPNTNSFFRYGNCGTTVGFYLELKNYTDIDGTNSSGCITRIKGRNEYYDCFGTIIYRSSGDVSLGY